MNNEQKSSDRTSDTNADNEQIVCNASLGAEEMPRFDKAVCVSFHSVRKRLADIDGISGKAALDGLVISGVLPDDSPKYVKEVRHTQEQGKVEKTIITIDEVDV